MNIGIYSTMFQIYSVIPTIPLRLLAEKPNKCHRRCFWRKKRQREYSNILLLLWSLHSNHLGTQTRGEAMAMPVAMLMAMPTAMLTAMPMAIPKGMPITMPVGIYGNAYACGLAWNLFSLQKEIYDSNAEMIYFQCLFTALGRGGQRNKSIKIASTISRLSWKARKARGKRQLRSARR